MSADAARLRIANRIALIALPFIFGLRRIGLAETMAIAAAISFALTLLEAPGYARTMHRRDVQGYVTVRAALGAVAAMLPFLAGRALAWAASG